MKGPKSSCWATALALLFQSIVALTLPMQGQFNKYGLAAQQHLAGTLPAERLMDFSPFYFHLSVVFERLLPWPLLALQGLQIVLVAVSVGLFHRLLLRRFNASLAALATLLFTVHPLVLAYERILEPEPFLLFFVLLILNLIEPDATWTPRSVYWVSWTAGLAAALCLATRPTFLPVFLLVPVFLRWSFRRQRRGPWIQASVAFMLPVLVMVGLLAWRAQRATGDWRTPVMNPGTVFFEGNNALSRGTSAIYPPVVLNFIQQSGKVIPDSGHAHYRTVARADAGAELTVRQVNGYWSDRAWSQIEQQPVAAAQRVLGKLFYALHNFSWHDVPTAWRYEASLPWPSIPFAWLSALALFGALIEAKSWHRSLLFYVLAGLQLSVMLVFYVSARQKLALLTAVLYFAAVALERLWQVKERRLILLALWALLSLMLWIPDAAMYDETYRRQGFRQALRPFDALAQQSPSTPAAASHSLIVEGFVHAPWWLERRYPSYFPQTAGALEDRVIDGLDSTSTVPAFVDSQRFDLASIVLGHEPDRFDEIITPLLGRRSAPVYRGGRGTSQPEVLQARHLIATQQLDEARAVLIRAVQQNPGDPFGLAEHVALNDDAESRQRLFELWSDADARFLLGQAQVRQQKFADATQTLEPLVASLPQFRDAKIYLAVALAGAGRFDEAAQHYLQATAQRGEPLLMRSQVVDLMREWAQRHPDDPRTAFHAAQILHRHGDFTKAVELLESQEPPPSMADAWARELAHLRANREVDRRLDR